MEQGNENKRLRLDKPGEQMTGLSGTNDEYIEYYVEIDKTFSCKKGTKCLTQYKTKRKPYIVRHVKICYKLVTKDSQCKICKQIFDFDTLKNHIYQLIKRKGGKLSAKNDQHSGISHDHHQKYYDELKKSK